MPESIEHDPRVEEAQATLRRGIGRSRKLAAEARIRLSELSASTPYAGPASLILAETADPAVEIDEPTAAET